MKKKSIYDEIELFFAKYIPPLSEKELADLEEKLIEASKKMDAKKFLGQFCIEMAIAQSVRSVHEEQKNGIEFSYYINSLELIIMNTPFSQKGNLIGSIGSGSSLFEIFVAKELFSESHIICMDFSRLCCFKSKKLAEEENTNNISFVICDALHLPFKKRFNIVWSIGSLVFDKKTTEQFRENVARILKTGGIAISAE